MQKASWRLLLAAIFFTANLAAAAEPPAVNAPDARVPAPTADVKAPGIAGVLAQAPPSTLSGGIACHGKDAKLLGEIEKEFDAFIQKHENFDETALRKSSSEKYCKWLTEVVLPLKSGVLARLEARMTDECGFDEIMGSQRDFAAWSFIDLKRRMSGPCLGVMDE